MMPLCYGLPVVCVFYGFLRSGEITVESVAEFDPEGHLCEGDVALDKLKNMAVVRVHILRLQKRIHFDKG